MSHVSDAIREESTECCANCQCLVVYPRNNKYNDVDYLCYISGYFMSGIKKDRHKVKHFSPGGKELKCEYKRKKNT